MFESDVGFSVSFTRQCCGIGSGGGGGAPPALAPRPRPAAAPGGGPAGAAPAGGGGGVNTPAGTTTADITVIWGVDRAFRLSQFVEAARRRAAASMASSASSAGLSAPPGGGPERAALHRSQFVAAGAAVCGAFCGRDATYDAIAIRSSGVRFATTSF